ncbi:MAG: Glycosyl transferase, family 2 [Candidatus Gottesmanbacteria bacterium GW2011_GWB1_43_11]|uniref:Glycosyl transferase, family 2 n=1 Tax=Candidatus Gottesmanbacteria bacterium GW2011_GWB1_43_11 TaxID=1618446 RepID=A0A0G1CNN4_9BACT|nr:MAG: Glycosyl transferase, family 2 [Candidatus Gottesmanbacteria bacterium GW2011_GWA2_42_16]KKS54100.1 MAG: Glycosyl transferase, family 2 [Candidatus Gottesmanbacteria bacterium GW2011_GWA1_42_26]KKS82188.1 MAG: Glycosyl transferase, family 2 [Candidatus Gottesmanbacteria bacterium GW2011_GWC1_43_10]KKS87087.1 MAG: Glycosyl transferase, family 2 [Candidatus Gottesmanbacteria bacterium GW2011_GWB1_43_11]OGG10424.1 MAG: hypothetical protein A2699_05150 [Candidatus Gottesmanbacteria bacteriu
MFSLVIPFYNEEACVIDVVTGLVKAARQAKITLQFILVNNGSRDRTGFLIRKLTQKYNNIRAITVLKNRGYGHGIRQGLVQAKTPYVGYMCGDGQIDPQDLVKLIREIRRHPKLDLVKVWRKTRYDGLKRKVISQIYNQLFRSLFQIQIRDVNGTPKIFKRALFEKLDLTADDWFIDAELMLKASTGNYLVKEIPIRFFRRQSGNSYVKGVTLWEFLRNLLWYRIKTLIYNE